jgi:hypothetical protein
MEKRALKVSTGEVVTVIWRRCERCAALGPRLITLVRRHVEDATQEIRTSCCTRLRAREPD